MSHIRSVLSKRVSKSGLLAQTGLALDHRGSILEAFWTTLVSILVVWEDLGSRLEFQ